MSKKILMVGALACLSAVAVAQSDKSSKDKAPAQSQTAAPQDAASAEATAKRMHKPITVTAEVGVQDAASKPTGKSAMISRALMPFGRLHSTLIPWSAGIFRAP